MHGSVSLLAQELHLLRESTWRCVDIEIWTPVARPILDAVVHQYWNSILSLSGKYFPRWTNQSKSDGAIQAESWLVRRLTT
jgi:hypothetical protein